jgi:hypothetical protein
MIDERGVGSGQGLMSCNSLEGEASLVLKDSGATSAWRQIRISKFEALNKNEILISQWPKRRRDLA